jgi:hypothetical protein
MTRLISLYPRPWRDRYEDEFLAMLSDRPRRTGDRVDIIRGAIDAHFHRLEPETPEPPRRPSWGVIATGMSAAIGGLSWLGWTAYTLLYFRGWGAGMPEHAEVGQALSLVAGLAFCAAIVGIASNLHPQMRQGGLLGGSLAGVGYFLAAFGGGMAAVLAFLGVAVVAWSLAGRVIPRWVAGAWIAGTITTGLAFVAFVAGEGRDVGLLGWALPHGIAWVLAGIAIATHRPAAPVIRSAQNA